MDLLIAFLCYLFIMDDLVFLHCGYIARCTATVDKFFEGYYTLQLMTAGEVELCYDDECHTLRDTAVWPAFPGPHIRFHAAPPAHWWTHRYAAFTGPRVARWVADGLWLEQPQRLRPRKKYERLFDDLLQHAVRPSVLDRRAATAILERLLIELAQDRVERQEHSEPWLHAVLQALEADFAPDYEALARKHGMAVSTLRRRFLAATGNPIHTHTVQMRIVRARELLGESEMPVKAIAAELGYADEFFFARQFKQFTGVAPAAYRRSSQ
jgi:AraC-like DNA-binding protein